MTVFGPVKGDRAVTSTFYLVSHKRLRETCLALFAGGPPVTRKHLSASPKEAVFQEVPHGSICIPRHQQTFWPL